MLGGLATVAAAPVVGAALLGGVGYVVGKKIKDKKKNEEDKHSKKKR